ncbi:hypothetical protein F5Y01DRAFT_299569 [Xylaria sp. FL0043]|nr:hypothetical protein F5Y01DRAFT_299569 [Xylaria sp. FL0043]
MQASLDSGALLRCLSLNDTSDTTCSPKPSRIVRFRWSHGWPFKEDLQGRITLTAFTLPSNDVSIIESWAEEVYSTIGQFIPEGCEDLFRRWPPMLMRRWTAWAWVDNEDALVDGYFGKLRQEANLAGYESKPSILCEFRRWNGYAGATPEREEIAAQNPLTQQSWAQAVAQVMPPVTAWGQERWDVQLLPRYFSEDEREDEEEDEELEYEQMSE